MRSVSVSLLVLAALAGCGGPGAPTGPYRLVALDSAGGLMAPGATVSHVQPGLLVEIRALDAEQRRRWLAEQAGVSEDPLAGFPAGRFLSFAMRLSATGELPLHLETQSLRLWPDKGRVNTAPLDYTRAFELLRPDQETGPRAREIETFMRGLLDGPVDIPGGGVREGLLVFPAPSPEARRVLLELPFVQVGSTTYRIRIPFEKTPLASPAGGEGDGRGGSHS